MGKRTPEERTVSWQRLGSAENGIGTPACRSHPLRRVLEAYLEETQRPLRKTGSDAGDRRPPRLSRPPSPSAGLSLAPRRPREPWFTGEVLSGRDAPARVSRQGQVSWRHRPGGGGIHPEATPSELRAREQRASWKVLYFIYQQHGGGKAQLQDPVITTSLGPLAGDGPSLHHSCPREVGMCPGPHKGARPQVPWEKAPSQPNGDRDGRWCTSPWPCLPRRGAWEPSGDQALPKGLLPQVCKLPKHLPTC